MAFTGVLRLSLRHGVPKLPPSAIRASNARLSSSLFMNTRTSSSPCTHPRSRNFWSSSKTAATSAPTASTSQIVEESTASVADVGSNTTSATSVSEVLEDSAAAVADVASSTPGAFENITDGITDIIASNIPAALQYGDLAAMGLAGWSPAGFVRWSMELINVSTGLPWFWTIVLGSAFWRLCCVPLAIVGLRESARMQPHQQELLFLRDGITAAAATKSPLEMQKAQLAMKNFNTKHNLNPARTIISLGQLPITLGLFFGVQKLGKVPLEQLKDSGFSLLPDLTVPDPTYVLPALFCALVNAQIVVGARDINTQQNPAMGHIMNLFRVLSFPGMYIMAGFPSVLLVSLLTTAGLTTLQSLILRNGRVRQMLQIPIIPPGARGGLPTFKESIQFLKDKLNSNNAELVAKTTEARRKQLQAQKFRYPPRR